MGDLDNVSGQWIYRIYLAHGCGKWVMDLTHGFGEWMWGMHLGSGSRERTGGGHLLHNGSGARATIPIPQIPDPDPIV